MFMNNPVWDAFRQMPPGREFEAYHHVSDSPQAVVYHSHPYFEIYFFLSGHNRVVVEGLDVELRRGDVLIYPPGVMHRNIHLDATVPYERFFLYATKEFLYSVSTPDCDIPGTLKKMTEGDRFCFHIEEEMLIKMIAFVDQIIARSNLQSPTEMLINRYEFSTLLIRTMNMMTSVDMIPQSDYSKGMGRLIRYINQHVTEPLSLDDLAREFHFSKFYLLREFKKYTGITVHQYLIMRRISVSQQLILNGSKPKEACLRCGFKDYASYYRAFRARVGMSPEQYRKSVSDAR